MTEIAALKKELHEYIENTPEYKLPELKPILSNFANGKLNIEPANFFERIKAKWRLRNPDNFVPLFPLEPKGKEGTNEQHRRK
jgi:hypothetical protein